MITIDTSGLTKFNAELDEALAALMLAVDAAYADWTRKVFKGLVEGSPQWSGDLASNWNYSVNGVDYSYDPQFKGPDGMYFIGPNGQELPAIHQRGDAEAVQAAISRMLTVTPPTWKDKVYFNNETPIATDVENMTVLIRPVNLVDGRVAMVQYTLENAAILYQPDV